MKTERVSLHLASHVSNTRWEDLSDEVVAHAQRCFVNFIGCAVGGSQHEAVDRLETALLIPGDTSQSIVIARPTRTHAQLSAMLNGTSASTNTFDDTHAQALVHPGTIIGAALVALAGRLDKVDPRQFLLAFAWGIEVTCRLSKSISVPPAIGDIGWSQSGVAGVVGSAIACAKFMGLETEQLLSALGTGATLSSGLRVAHGSMSMHLIAGQAAATGVQSVLLAQNGFTGPANALEGRYGFLHLFAEAPHVESLIGELGERFELLSNTFKAYPCGLVIHAAIDASLKLRSEHSFLPEAIESVRLGVPNDAGALTDRRHPSSEFDAKVSAQHWVAAALVYGRAGIEEGTQRFIDDESVREIRNRCVLNGDPKMPADASEVSILLKNGVSLSVRVDHFSGSLANPMDDAALDRKFLVQCSPVLGLAGAQRQLDKCRSFLALGNAAEAWTT